MFLKLKKESLDYCEKFIFKHGRLLEKELYKHFFIHENSSNVLRALSHYQNDDGGFGHGIEPDALLPLSSPFQTSVGVRYLTLFDDRIEALQMIKKAIKYFEENYQEELHGWFSLPKEVNQYPHTIWWEYNESEKMTPIDKNFGNPTAEIVAYLVRYKDYLTKLDAIELTNYLLEYIESKDIFESEHELYCFIKLYNELNGTLKDRLEKCITKGVSQLVVYDTSKWKTSYVPTALDFIDNPNMSYFGIEEKEININLDFIINELTKYHIIIPSWGDQFYQEDFKKSFSDWKVIKTLEALISLKKFNRILE